MKHIPDSQTAFDRGLIPDADTQAAGDGDTDLDILKSVPPAFAVDCADHANWLVRKIVDARQYSERVKLWAAKEQQRAAREEKTLLFLFGRQLETWANDEITKQKGYRKSTALPAGTVGFRTVAAKLVIDDEEEVLRWAKAQLRDAIVTVEKVSMSAIKAHFDSTGETPTDGIHLEPEQQRFYIK